jgi:hypothetical protein
VTVTREMDTRRSWRFYWPAAPLAAIGVGIVILAAPARVEGPVLVPISPGHALSLLDIVGVIPLLAGSAFVYLGLWKRRPRLYGFASQKPGIAAASVFGGGLGLGLLIASSFSAFFWWWAVGAVLFGFTLVAAVAVAARR